MTEFITLGEPLVVLASENQDISLDAAEHFSKYLAGAELNVAIGLSRLGHLVIVLLIQSKKRRLKRPISPKIKTIQQAFI